MSNSSGTTLLDGFPQFKAAVEIIRRRGEALHRLLEMIRKPEQSTKRIGLCGCTDSEFLRKHLPNDAQVDLSAIAAMKEEKRLTICEEIDQIGLTNPSRLGPSHQNHHGHNGHRQSARR